MLLRDFRILQLVDIDMLIDKLNQDPPKEHWRGLGSLMWNLLMGFAKQERNNLIKRNNLINELYIFNIR